MPSAFQRKSTKAPTACSPLSTTLSACLELDAQGVSRTEETVELLAVAKECADLLDYSAARRGVAIAVRGEAAFVRAARRDAEELIYNLCDNAVRYNKEHGSVTVTVENTPGGARLCVRDTGIGIAEQHRERVVRTLLPCG